jgi:hypothetical protein
MVMEECDTPLLKPGQDGQTGCLQWGDRQKESVRTPDVLYLQTKSSVPEDPPRSGGEARLY